MLAVLAALVPVLASLYVASATMRDHFAQVHRARTAARIWERYNAERAEVTDGDPDVEAKFKAMTARRMMLLEASGLDPYVGTVRALNASAMPATPTLTELRRQWILLLSSAISLVFLAIELLSNL